MARVCGRYSKYLHERGQLVGRDRVFESRYDAKVVAPEYLVHAIRRVERVPVELGLCRVPMEYAFSSSRRLGEGRPGWLASSLRSSGGAGQRAEAVRRAVTPLETSHGLVASLFDRGSRLDKRVVGDQAFVEWVYREAQRRPTPPTREQLISAVNRLLSRAATDVLEEGSYEALKKALVACHAVRNGAATLTEVGGWYGVTAAALRGGINRYRHLLPKLFVLPLDELMDEGMAVGTLRSGKMVVDGDRGIGPRQDSWIPGRGSLDVGQR